MFADLLNFSKKKDISSLGIVFYLQVIRFNFSNVKTHRIKISALFQHTKLYKFLQIKL